jgi:hypothetical protein
MSTATVGTTPRLQSRAHRLREQAASLHPLVAEAYRRRAAELDVQAWLEAVWNPPIDLREGGATDGPAATGAGDRRPDLAVA